MKHRSMMCVFFLSIYLTGSMIGCATVKTWSSAPSTQTVSNDAFEASLEPRLKEGQTYYDRFLFKLKNKTESPLVIDWQNSRYLQNGKQNGRMIFKGVTNENIGNLPPDTVAPGAEISKVIAPLFLVGHQKLSSRSFQPGGPAVSAGVIPEGEHGLLLIVKAGQKKISEKISLKIMQK